MSNSNSNRNDSQGKSGAHADMNPPQIVSDAPIIAPFQPPMLSGDELNTPFDEVDRKSLLQQYWSQHWQVICGVALLAVLLISAIALLLWNPKKPGEKEPAQRNSSLQMKTELSWNERISILSSLNHRE